MGALRQFIAALFACVYLYILTFRISWRLNNERNLKADPYFLAFAVTALFAVHPLTTGSVAYMSGRAGVLLGINYFLALNCFLLGYCAESNLFAACAYILTYGFTAMALLCSPQAITLPLAIICLALLMKPPAFNWTEWLKSRGFDLFLFGIPAIFMPALLITGLAPSALNSNIAGIPTLPAVSYWATQLKELVTYYLRCAVIPFGLSIDPPYAVATNFADPLAIIGAATIVGAIFAAWKLRQNAVVSFGLVIFVLGLMPSIFLVQNKFIADERFYLSLSGLCMSAGWLLGALYLKDKRKAITVTASIVVLLTGLTIWRNLEWKTDLSLWQQAVAVNPESSVSRAFYADVLLKEGKEDEALAQATKSLQLDRRSYLALQVLAHSQMTKQQYEKAVESLKKAIAIGDEAHASPMDIAKFHRDLASAILN